MWAKALLQTDFVIFDCETTGLNSQAEIIQMGIVNCQGVVILDQLIKPEIPIGGTFPHRITNEMVENAPRFPEVYPAIRAALEKRIVVAYNWAFDWQMLGQEVNRHGLEDFAAAEAHCAMMMFAQWNGEWNRYYGDYKWKSLAFAVNRLGLQQIAGMGLHHAERDCKATLAVIQGMARLGG